MILGPHEFAWLDGEDLQSCFNLFYFETCWRRYFVFAKQVSKAAFGGPANELTYVALRSVPMGWLNSVDLIQNFIRKFVFPICQILAAWEVRKDVPFPKQAAAVVCMDGFDPCSRVKILDDLLEGVGRSLESFERRLVR